VLGHGVKSFLADHCGITVLVYVKYTFVLFWVFHACLKSSVHFWGLHSGAPVTTSLLMEELICRYLQEKAMGIFYRNLIFPYTPKKLKSFLAAWIQFAGRARVGSFSYRHSLARLTHK
jgi:hypothetical protein